MGEIVTMDDRRPIVEALAIVDGRVTAWGSVSEVRAECPAGTPVRHLTGTVVPGLIDSHVHMLWAGRARERADLAGCRDIPEVLARIRAFAARHPHRTWLEGVGDIDAEGLREGRFPNRTELDEASDGRPLFLDRRSHDALVNSPALAAAGIGPGTPDPPGGRIERDESGEPTGLLVERPAADLVERVIPSPTTADRERWLRNIQPEFHAAGLTSVVDAALTPDELLAYRSLSARGQLTMRTTAMPLGDGEVPPDEHMAGFASVSAAIQQDDGPLRVGPVKIFLDGGGSLGTALLREPWPDRPCYHGHQTTSVEGLRAYAKWCAANDQGLGVHCVGGAGIDMTLGVFADVDRVRPIAELGFTLIHAYLWPSDENMATARNLNVLVATQAPLQWSFGPGLVRRFGPEAVGRAHPIRSWLDAGVTVGGGSDGPGDAPVSPLFAFWQMRTRAIAGSDRPVGPDEAIDARQALALYTTGAAAVAGTPDCGRLAPGCRADVTVLDVDPLTASPEECRDGQATLVMVSGEVVHEA